MKELKLEDLQQNFSVHIDELNASPVVEYLRDKQDGLLTESQLKAIHHLLGFDTSKDIEVMMLEEGTEYKSLLTNLTHSEGYIYVGYKRLDRGFKKYGDEMRIKFLYGDNVQDTIDTIIGSNVMGETNV